MTGPAARKTSVQTDETPGAQSGDAPLRRPGILYAILGLAVIAVFWRVGLKRL